MNKHIVSLFTTRSHSALSGAQTPISKTVVSSIEKYDAATLRAISYAAQVRRNKTRRLWVSKDDPNSDRDADFWIFPRERLGTDPSLNFALHNYKIVPQNDAYRNLHLGGLVMLSKGSTDKNKALHVQLNEGDDQYTVYYGEKGPAHEKDAKVLNINQYKEILKEMKEHISHSENIFVHDGAIGSHSSVENRIRVITNNAASALYLYHVVPRVSIKDVNEFQHGLTAYIVPSYTPSNAKELGISGKNFVLVDVARGIAIVAGTSSTEAVRAALSTISQSRFLKDFDSVPLDAHVVSFKEGSPILVVNPEKVDLGSEASVDGAHNVAWGGNGVVRYFDGATSDGKNTKKGDLVESFKGTLRSTSRQPISANIHAHPSSLVFVLSDQSRLLPPLSRVTAEGLEKFLLAGYTGGKKQFTPFFSDNLTTDPKAAVQKLVDTVKANNATVYVVNTLYKDGGKMEGKEVSNILKTIAQGKANEAAGVKNVFSFMQPIPSVKGLDFVLDPTKRGWDSNSYKGEISKFEKTFSDFLTTKYPQPTTEQQQQPQK